MSDSVQSHPLDNVLLPTQSCPQFSPKLAELYEFRRGHGRKRHLAVALILTAFAVIMAAAVDLNHTSTGLGKHLAFRVLEIVLCLVGAISIQRVHAGLQEAIAFSVPILGQALLSGWIAASAPVELADRDVVASLILFGVLCAVPPLPVLASRILAGLVFAGFTLMFRLSEPNGAFLHHLLALGLGGVALAIAAGLAGLRESGRRREFLLGVQAELSAAELGRSNARLERLMNTDVLTGVANRRQFEADMAAAWQAMSDGRDRCGGIGLILVDVDHFKGFNDGAGHAEGDSCLRAIANAIGTVVRSNESSVARWGGEEFAVLAPGMPREAMARVAERVRAAVEDLAIPHPGRPGRIVTISAGAAWCGPGATCSSADDLLRLADGALYDAKRSGRNRIMVAEKAHSIVTAA